MGNLKLQGGEPFSLVYLHGFLSSPKSFKAVKTGQWLSDNNTACEFLSPFLHACPIQAKVQLDFLAHTLKGSRVCYIGSSLGGFWATYMVERYGGCACLVNPAVHPNLRIAEFLGQTLKNYHTEDHYRLSHRDIECLAQSEAKTLVNPAKYQVLLQSRDEVLDYRLAQKYYRDSELHIEEGGSHSFDGYENWLPVIYRFLRDNASVVE